MLPVSHDAAAYYEAPLFCFRDQLQAHNAEHDFAEALLARNVAHFLHSAMLLQLAMKLHSFASEPVASSQC